MKLYFKLIIFLFLMVFIISCENQKPVKIGFVASLSGRTSQLGIVSRNAVMMAVSEVNKTGGINGRKLELIIKDDASSQDTVFAVTKELIRENVVAIIGPLTSNMAEASLDSIKNEDVLMISPSMSTNVLVDIDDNFIRLISTNSHQSRTLAKLVSADKIKNIAVVYDVSNRLYTGEIYSLFKQYVEQTGVNVSKTITIDHTRKDFVQIAKDIKESGVDGLLIVTNGIDAASICQQLYKIEYQVQKYSVPWASTSDLIQLGGKSVENLKIFTYKLSEESNPRIKSFNDRYRSLYHTDPSFIALLSYESATTLFSGMRKSKSFSPQKIKKAIIDIGEFEGLQDKFTINGYGDNMRNLYLLKIQNGQFVQVSR